jgi:hypothetical protein
MSAEYHRLRSKTAAAWLHTLAWRAWVDSGCEARVAELMLGISRW